MGKTSQSNSRKRPGLRLDKSLDKRLAELKRRKSGSGTLPVAVAPSRPALLPPEEALSMAAVRLESTRAEFREALASAEDRLRLKYGSDPAQLLTVDFAGNVDQVELENVRIALPKYQFEALCSTARVLVLEWCRQAGKDFISSLIAVLDALETRRNWYIVSLTLRQAQSTMKKVQQHLRAIAGILVDIGEEVIESRRGDEIIRENALKAEIRWPDTGFVTEIVALPGKYPDTLAGLTGNVIFTEMALFPGGGVQHWRTVFPLTTRGFRVIAISTPRGPNTKFAELVRNTAGTYQVIKANIHRILADGVVLKDHTGKPITAADLERDYNDPIGWRRDYLCEEVEDGTPLIGWQYISAASRSYRFSRISLSGKDESDLLRQLGIVRLPGESLQGCLERWWRALLDEVAALGWDIAVTGDLSAIALGQRIGPKAIRLAAMITMKGCDNFEFQESFVAAAMAVWFAFGDGDATGIGRASCQKLEKAFPGRFEPVVFSGRAKSDLFVGFMSAVQSECFLLPEDPEIQHDVASIIRIGDSGGDSEDGSGSKTFQLTCEKNPLNRSSHADMATACALLWKASTRDGAPTSWTRMPARDPEPTSTAYERRFGGKTLL